MIGIREVNDEETAPLPYRFQRRDPLSEEKPGEVIEGPYSILIAPL